NGDVLVPVTYSLVPKRASVTPGERNPIKIYDLTGPGYRREVRLLRSKDSGKSWTIEEPNLPKPFFRFGRLLETDDGRLIMPGEGWYAVSRDFGRTWGTPLSLGTRRFHDETNIA